MIAIIYRILISRIALVIHLQRRIAVEYKNYYFTPLRGTPFSLGLSIPEGYGSYYINPGNEVEKNVHKKIPIVSYLKGSPWRIHPDW